MKVDQERSEDPPGVVFEVLAYRGVSPLAVGAAVVQHGASRVRLQEWPHDERVSRAYDKEHPVWIVPAGVVQVQRQPEEHP